MSISIQQNCCLQYRSSVQYPVHKYHVADTGVACEQALFGACSQSNTGASFYESSTCEC